MSRILVDTSRWLSKEASLASASDCVTKSLVLCQDSKAGLPARSLFRERVAIGTFLQNWVLKGSLLWVKSPYFTISYENNAYFLGKSFQFLLLLDLLLHALKQEAQKETEL